MKNLTYNLSSKAQWIPTFAACPRKGRIIVASWMRAAIALRSSSMRAAHSGIQKTFLLTLGLLACTMAYGDDQITTINQAQVPKYYQVEVIVFEHMTPEAYQSETWPTFPGFPSFNNTLLLTDPSMATLSPNALSNYNGEQTQGSLDSAVKQRDDSATSENGVATSENGVATSPNLAANPQTSPRNFAQQNVRGPQATALLEDPNAPPLYQRLPSKDFVLNKEEKALSKQPGYQILLHVAWIQPLTNGRDAKTVHLYGGQSYETLSQQASLDTTAAMDDEKQNLMDTPDPSIDEPTAWQLNGTLRVSQSNYVNVRTDLLLNEKTSDLPISPGLNFHGSNIKSFRLIGSQRMRQKELHYIDHPLFGMLIKVVPIDNNDTSKPSEKDSKT